MSNTIMPDEAIVLVEGEGEEKHGRLRVVFVDSELVGASFFIETTISFMGQPRKIVSHLREHQVDMLKTWLQGHLDKTTLRLFDLADVDELELEDHEHDFALDGGYNRCLLCGETRGIQ